MEPVRIGVILGSVREGRVGPVVADWVMSKGADNDAVALELIDLADWDFPADYAKTDVTKRWGALIESLDAIIVVTSEYNHGYPPVVKTALDALKYEWRGKPIGFVAYGGLAGGRLAVEQLRLVAIELHLLPVRQSVGFPQIRKLVARGEGLDNELVSDHLQSLFDELSYWVRARRALGEAYPG